MTEPFRFQIGTSNRQFALYPHTSRWRPVRLSAAAKHLLPAIMACSDASPDGTLYKNYMGVSTNRGGPPKSSILIRFSIINHPFWGTPIFGNTHIDICQIDLLFQS